MTSLAPLMSSEDMTWRTPESFLQLVRQVSADGVIGLDPCTSPNNPCRATRFFTEADDGLRQSWSRSGLVYANPPYGRALKMWALKFAEEGRSSELIALVPARPDTRWFQDNLIQADALCFWKGRIKFVGAPTGAPFPSLVAYWGARKERFAQVFGPRGWIP